MRPLVAPPTSLPAPPPGERCPGDKPTALDRPPGWGNLGTCMHAQYGNLGTEGSRRRDGISGPEYT